MDLIADTLMAAGALGAAIYCIVLSRRLKRFNNLQNGMGGAVAVLSAQVDDMTKTLIKAQSAAGKSAEQLGDLTQRAEAASRKLELMMASLHDLPEENATAQDAVAPRQPDSEVDTDKPQTSSEADLSVQVPVFLSHRHKHLEAAE
ncbi:hypothetical protein KKW20_11085 [Planktotalea lamellibrachiae]|nr:hypothetical protein [Aliiroseovarius lamellibrachiae]MBT2131658.1 hypothetical protein [Aliiroseovarius lamellibrachiae]